MTGEEQQPQPVAATFDAKLLSELIDSKFDGLPKDTLYGDFRDDLVRDGYAVIKEAIPRDRANAYADKMFTYLEELSVSVGT